MNGDARLMDDKGPAVGVIGIGNLLLKDEGVGVHAVRALARRALDDGASPQGIRFVDGGTDPWAALSEVGDCRKLLVLDAVVGGKGPGEFHCLALEDVDTGGAAMSLHGLTLFHLLNYERLLGNGFDDICVLGMEPAEVAPGIGLSELCQARLPAFMDVVTDQIHGMISRDNKPDTDAH
ncbi:MAG: hypothetical protein AMK73_00470 [Planctomycetes bacterium SM23_32]|nr:MAG: hypothetical protein AMK73_00470 [Planctomycetes bacterium SM23_32]